MRLGGIEGFAKWVSASPLCDDRIWSRDHEQVSEMEIQLFYARARRLNLETKAHDAIDRLQTAMILASVNSKLTSCEAIVLHEIPESRFLVDELVDGLVNLSEPRRQACIFALEANLRPDTVTTLTWTETVQSGIYSKINDLARETLRAAGRTRHLRLPYVFWEWASKDVAAPLLQFEESVTQAFGLTWPQLKRKYGSMVMLDRRADSASLMQLVGMHPTQ